MEEIYGDPVHVIRTLMRQLAEGQINAEQAAELLKVMTQPDEGIDVTLGFRVALVSQGYEREALKLGRVRMHLVEAGAMFNYSVAATDDDWLDARHEELDPVFLRASIMVLRSGNIDAVLDPDTPNQMVICGEIIPKDVDQLVGMFREEIDEAFPDTPPQRQGKWW